MKAMCVAYRRHVGLCESMSDTRGGGGGVTDQASGNWQVGSENKLISLTGWPPDRSVASASCTGSGKKEHILPFRNPDGEKEAGLVLQDGIECDRWVFARGQEPMRMCWENRSRGCWIRLPPLLRLWTEPTDGLCSSERDDNKQARLMKIHLLKLNDLLIHQRKKPLHVTLRDLNVNNRADTRGWNRCTCF